MNVQTIAGRSVRGGGPGREWSPGDYRCSIRSGGLTRTFLLHIPEGFDPKAKQPLVLAFHGRLGDGEGMADLTEFSREADRRGMIVAYPDGIDRSWNDGRILHRGSKEDDVGFVRDLIRNLKGELPVDAKRIYAMGISNGGMFTHRLAIEIGDQLAAIATDVGPLPTILANQTPREPVPVLMIQGTDDPIVPVEGGLMGHGQGFVESAEDSADFWLYHNGERGLRGPRELPPRVPDGTFVDVYESTPGRPGHRVELVVIEGMGHQWPSSPPIAPVIAGPTSRNYEASRRIADFFEREHR